MTENKYFQKTLATHLTELRDPLLGCDPQFGKPCTTQLCLSRSQFTLCKNLLAPIIIIELLLISAQSCMYL